MPVTDQELQSFTRFVSEQMEQDNALSLEQCLDRWRAQQERAETIAAVRRGEADVAAGRVHSLDEVDAAIRKKYGFPPRTRSNTNST
ncbi:MAG: hypothetical protein ACE5KM_07730 [Planctomycetaceae bacterium]